jgi:hypothetical protein
MCEYAKKNGGCPLEIKGVYFRVNWCHDYDQQALCVNKVNEGGVNREFMHRRGHKAASQYAHQANVLFSTGSTSDTGSVERCIASSEEKS